MSNSESNETTNFENNQKTIRHQELLIDCIGKELKEIRYRVHQYDSAESTLVSLILKFDNWLIITVEDDHIYIRSEKTLAQPSEGLVETVDESEQLNHFKHQQLKGFHLITDDSRFTLGLCFDFEQKNRFIFANCGYDNRGSDAREIFIEN